MKKITAMMMALMIGCFTLAINAARAEGPGTGMIDCTKPENMDSLKCKCERVSDTTRASAFNGNKSGCEGNGFIYVDGKCQPKPTSEATQR